MWLNAYNKRCLDETGAYLLARGKQQAYDWLKARTDPIPEDPNWNCGVSDGASNQPPTFGLCILALVITGLLDKLQK